MSKKQLEEVVGERNRWRLSIEGPDGVVALPDGSLLRHHSPAGQRPDLGVLAKAAAAPYALALLEKLAAVRELIPGGDVWRLIRAAQTLAQKLRLVSDSAEEATFFQVWPPDVEASPGSALDRVADALATLRREHAARLGGEACACTHCTESPKYLAALQGEWRDAGIEEAAQTLADSYASSLWRYLHKDTLADVLLRMRSKKGDLQDSLVRRLEELRARVEVAEASRDSLQEELLRLRGDTLREATPRPGAGRPVPFVGALQDAHLGVEEKAPVWMTNERRWELAKLPGGVSSFRNALEMLPAQMKLLDTATGTIFTVAELLEEGLDNAPSGWVFRAHVHAGTSEYRLWLRCELAGAVYMETTAGV